MITIENVSFKYKQGAEILKDVNLTIEEGKCIAVIGKNGSGKSTLGRLIAGITKPSKGNILIDELNTRKKESFLEIRKKIGIVFQNPENQILFSTVKDDMIFALNNLKMDTIEQRVKRALEQVNMQGFESKDTYELSLGQKQRIAIAGALAIDTKYLVLDEPTTMLDPNGKEAIYSIVEELKKQGYTIIYITNVMDEILLSDSVIVMEDGKLVNQFAKNELIDHIEEIQKSGIKIPTILQTVLELKENGIEVQPKEWTMKELVKEIVRVCKK